MSLRSKESIERTQGCIKASTCKKKPTQGRKQGRLLSTNQESRTIFCDCNMKAKAQTRMHLTRQEVSQENMLNCIRQKKKRAIPCAVRETKANDQFKKPDTSRALLFCVTLVFPTQSKGSYAIKARGIRKGLERSVGERQRGLMKDDFRNWLPHSQRGCTP